MPDAYTYEYAHILHSGRARKPFKELSGLERARIKKARTEKVRYEGSSFNASPSESGCPEVPANTTRSSSSRHERSTERQRASLGYSSASFSQISTQSCVVAPIRREQDSTDKPTISGIAGNISQVNSHATEHQEASLESPTKLHELPENSSQETQADVFQSLVSNQLAPQIAPTNVWDKPDDIPPTTKDCDSLEDTDITVISDDYLARLVEMSAGEVWGPIDSADLDETLSSTTEAGVSSKTSFGSLGTTSSSHASDTDTTSPQKAVVADLKRKVEVEVDLEAIGEPAEKKKRVLTSRNANMSLEELTKIATASNPIGPYQSPYSLTQDARFSSKNRALLKVRQQDSSSALRSSQSLSQSSPLSQPEKHAVNPIGVVGGVFRPRTPTMYHRDNGNSTTNHGVVTYNVKEQYIMQMPQLMKHHQHCNDSQQPMDLQASGPKSFISPDFLYGSQSPHHNTHHQVSDTLSANLNITFNHTGQIFHGSVNIQSQAQRVNAQLPSDIAQAPIYCPQGSNPFRNNHEHGIAGNFNIASKSQHLGPIYGMNNGHHRQNPQTQQHSFPAHSQFNLAKGFSIQNTPHRYQEPHVPGSEQEPYFREPIGFRELPNYGDKYNTSDMPFHIWQQGKDISISIDQSLRTQGLVSSQISSMTRLFDPEELRWLGKQAKEGEQRHSQGLNAVSLEILTYQFRHLYCWNPDDNLKWRLNDVLLKVQEKPTYYRVSRNPNMPPWVVKNHWRTVYVRFFPDTFDGMTFQHAYWLDWGDRGRFPTANPDKVDRTRAFKEYNEWRMMGGT